MKTIYQAFDGKIFEDKTKCNQYEEELLFPSILKDVAGFDADGKFIPLLNRNDLSEFFRKCCYVHFKTDLAADIVCRNTSYWDIQKKGMYVFEPYAGEWFDLQEVIKDTKEKLSLLISIEKLLQKESENNIKNKKGK